MDDFVTGKLVEWGLGHLLEKFKEQDIDEESLYCLEDQDIDNLISEVGPRAKFRKNLKSLKDSRPPLVPNDAETSTRETGTSTKPLPSTSQNAGKRKMDPHSEGNEWPSPAKRATNLPSPYERIILKDVKTIMEEVHSKLRVQDKTRLNSFLRTKIKELETDQRELVGVFGKTGAGKSSLINAIIGEKNLLPSGSVTACTSVMIKVEGNMQSSKYEAEIEFITPEEWKDELWSMLQFLQDSAEQDNEDDKNEYKATVEKLSALYGEEWRGKQPESFMDNKFFKEIPEFLEKRKKILRCDSAQDLSARFLKYTRNGSNKMEDKGIKRWYWPLVKCVTLKVPDNDLLQHVTLVDLPGNGDSNKSRDKMWKEFVGSCSTVWIVTEINRAASDQQAWDILQRVSHLIGNGGECRRIHFICTKSDQIDSDDHSTDHVRSQIVERNNDVKAEVKKKLLQEEKIKKHLGEDYFTVYTVSSTEFQRGKYLQPNDTEIPALQEYLMELNDCHSETLNYVSGARGILSLIEGARHAKEAGKTTNICAELGKNLQHQLDKVRHSVEETCRSFEKHLAKGAEQSKTSCEKKLSSVLYPKNYNRNFVRTLKCLVQKGGVHKPSRGKLIDLNMKLSSCLTGSINEKFRKTFPNEGKCDQFNGAIRRFSLGTEQLMKKYKDEELQLRFLKTEEAKIKATLNRIIRDRKKSIYQSLESSIENSMQECYNRAATFEGANTQQNIRDTLATHVHQSKAFMFETAKLTMLALLRGLQEEILQMIEETLMKSIELSFKADAASIPDVSAELKMVKQHHDELKKSSN